MDSADLTARIDAAAALLGTAEGRRLAIRVCAREGLQAADADDVIQQCWIRLATTFARHVEQERPALGDDDLRRYVARALRNTARDWWRADARNPEQVLDVHDEAPESVLERAQAQLDRSGRGAAPTATGASAGGLGSESRRARVLEHAAVALACRSCAAPVVVAAAVHLVSRIAHEQPAPTFLGLEMAGGTDLLDRAMWEALILADPARYGRGHDRSAAIRQRKRRCQVCVLELLGAVADASLESRQPRAGASLADPDLDFREGSDG